MSANWFEINNVKNSKCDCGLSELDWERQTWWMDNYFAQIYLHVPNKSNGTIHRVYPKFDVTGIALENGTLYWIKK